MKYLQNSKTKHQTRYNFQPVCHLQIPQQSNKKARRSKISETVDS